MKLECPKCGGKLQGSILMSIDVSKDGVQIVGIDDDSPSWYCENDHELPAKMVEYLTAKHLSLGGVTVYRG